MKQLLTILFPGFLFLILFSSCEELYFPNLDKMPEILVVESHITNDSRLNYVKITTTNGFYETVPNESLKGINVKLIDINGKTLTATDNGKGNFAFPETPTPGRKYKLKITYQNDIYESDTVRMPSLPSIDDIYSLYKVSKTYRTDAFGPPVLIETPGREIYIDAPITQTLQYYRFDWRAVLLWCITPPPTPMGFPASTYGWNSLYDKDLINLAGQKKYSEASQVKKHPILSIPYDYRVYIDAKEKIENGWILIIDQYGIDQKSHDFYEQFNKQLTAEGHLFDPVLTQINGNIHCTNDPSKKIVGFFEVNSYRQHRYYFNLWGIDQGKVILRELNRYPDIPNEGQVIRTPPEFWEYTY
jgi:hypothetical protein